MSRGKKLDLFIGTEIEDSLAPLKTPRKSVVLDETLEPSKHFLFFKKEKRRGKVVTLVGPFALLESNAALLLAKLKKKLGCGGAYKDNFMEFQGELKEKLREQLIQEEFRFKAGH